MPDEPRDPGSPLYAAALGLWLAFFALAIVLACCQLADASTPPLYHPDGRFPGAAYTTEPRVVPLVAALVYSVFTSTALFLVGVFAAVRFVMGKK